MAKKITGWLIMLALILPLIYFAIQERGLLNFFIEILLTCIFCGLLWVSINLIMSDDKK